MSKEQLVTRSSLTRLVTANNDVAMHATGRALVHLLKRQTYFEQGANITRDLNDIGFTPQDARRGTITAKYYIKNKKLLDWMVDYWTTVNVKGVPRISKYWRQLNEVAVERAATYTNNDRLIEDTDVVAYTFTDGVTWTAPGNCVADREIWWKDVHGRVEMLQENEAHMRKFANG